MRAGWGHSTGTPFTWEVKNKFLSNNCIVVLMVPRSDGIRPTGLPWKWLVDVRAAQRGAERGPTAQMSALLLCPVAWGNHLSISSRKQQRGKQSPWVLPAAATCPPR